MKVWDANGGLIRTLRGHRGAVRCHASCCAAFVRDTAASAQVTMMRLQPDASVVARFAAPGPSDSAVLPAGSGDSYVPPRDVSVTVGPVVAGSGASLAGADVTGLGASGA